MVEGKSIEVLSIMFTVGVALGAFVSSCAFSPAVQAILLPLSALPFFFWQWLRRQSSNTSLSLILLSFLTLGIAVSVSHTSYPGEELIPQEWTAGAAQKLKELIASIPFPDSGTAPLLTALLTGDKSGLTKETVAAFRGSGASHILALSGLHMGILYLIFARLTAPLGKTKTAIRIRAALVVSASLWFTLMTGAGPSLVRAFLFICIGEAYTLSGRKSTPSRVLCLALLVQLVISPGVIRELGFQLSYLAMAGIVTVYPVLEKWYPSSGKYDPFQKIWQMAALSISCQLFTGPLAWRKFGTFPQHFLLTNLMAIPLVSVLMGAAVTCVVLQGIGWCPMAVIKITDGLSRLLVWVLEVISS